MRPPAAFARSSFAALSNVPLRSLGRGGERARSFGEKENAGAYCLGVSGIYPSFLSDGDGGAPRGALSDGDGGESRVRQEVDEGHRGHGIADVFDVFVSDLRLYNAHHRVFRYVNRYIIEDRLLSIGEMHMPGRCAVKADGLRRSKSGAQGCSSRMCSTRFPAANVFCRVLPSAASATTGPKEENSAMVGINTPA